MLFIRGRMVASRRVSGAEDEGCEETLTDTSEKRAGPLPEVMADHVFVVLEGSRPTAGSSRHSLSNVDDIVIGRSPTRNSVRASNGSRCWTLAVGIPDARISGRHARIQRVREERFIEDLGSRNGTWVNGRRIVSRESLSDGDVIQVGQALLRYRAALAVPVGTVPDLDSARDGTSIPLGTMIPSFADRIAMLARVSRSLSPILLLGESGTGKEVAARGIHRISERKGPFQAINCGALPATLIEAQLFGHVRGAFSGAVTDAPGLLRSAEGGTLLLDEIGDLPGPCQAALLRVLQEREVVPVGGVRPIKLDLRVVAATHRPLAALVARGDFRNDLFARIAGFTFALPALRDRKEDIGLMVEGFARDRPLRLSAEAARALFEHDWPLNVRELHQVLDVATTLARGDPIRVDHLHATISAPAFRAASANGASDASDSVRIRLVAALARHSGNVSAAARDLGKARMQVQRWIKRFGIDARQYR
jgi:hypothetical protein